MNMNDQPTHAIIVGEDMMTEQQYSEKQYERLQKMYTQMASMRDRWVKHRASSGVERRWKRSNDLYHGEGDEGTNSLERTLRDGPSRQVAEAVRSRVTINIVRPKVDLAVARMCEILLPVDDRNWGLKPTPVPEISGYSKDERQTVDPATGQPTGLTAADEARLITQAAQQSAEAMIKEIDDTKNEANFNGESRKLLENGVRLGTGIMRGPFLAKKTSKVWQPNPDGTQELILNHDIVPADESVDPWCVYFDPACGNDHQRGRGVWYKRPVTRRELRALAEIPGYDADAIRKVLKENPRKVVAAEGRVIRQNIEDDSYELWEYHGEVEPEDMEFLGDRVKDPLRDVDFGVIAMVNDCIVGAMPSWVADKTLPYHVWCWRKSDDSPYGHGLPEELDHQQRVVIAAWRQVMDNGKASMGGQIVFKKGQVRPVDGHMTISPMKLWEAKDDIADVRQAFAIFEFSSHLQELLAIAQAAMAFADQETNMPQLMGGNQTQSTPETVGGMVMMYNNAGAPLRRRVKAYDDDVTRPNTRQHYDWHMANNPKADIKGDYEVDARGSTSLLERDIQNQALLNLAAITNNPRYAPHLKERAELKAILRAFRVDPEEIMKSEEEVEQAMASQQPQQDPRIAAAEMTIKAKEMDIADRKEQRDFERERNQQELGFRRENLSYNSQREQAEYEIAQTDSAIKRDTTLMKLSQDGQLQRESQAARERLELLKIQNDCEIFNAEAAIKVRQGSGI